MEASIFILDFHLCVSNSGSRKVKSKMPESEKKTFPMVICSLLINKLLIICFLRNYDS